eukprot:TRINITY_DN6196_c0_g1_i1.p1 TRINITY_DN6196_c0_g1~~TRINITY_DN6196_c0_g1_i1.p1  ORF type:complete len:503 (-),score=129.15 TRINITY_DN6196_c0_g1_i1:29-1537(-)
MRWTCLFILNFILNVIHLTEGSYLWSWMKGNNSMILGDDPTPSGLLDAAIFPKQNGTIFLFGGYGTETRGSPVSNLQNTIWSYETSSNLWKIVDGDPTLPNQVSKHRSSDGFERPSSRFDAASWIGSKESLWIFGGYGCQGEGNQTCDGADFLGDLWRFDGQWTQILFSNGSLVPTARRGAACWSDGGDRLWMYGGTGVNKTGSQGLFADLWYYQISLASWKHVHGNQDSLDILPHYNPDLSSNPGSRRSSATWIDSDGVIWLFGGVTPDGDRGDLWKYLPASKIWIFMAGPDTPDQPGIYSEIGVAIQGQFPGCRREPYAAIGDDDILYLFGGEGFASHEEGYLNDLWKYDPFGDGAWFWMGGSSDPGSRSNRNLDGEMGSQFHPGARNGGKMWIQDGVAYIFGGYGYSDSNAGVLNEIWKLTYVDDVPSNQSSSNYDSQLFSGLTLGIAIAILGLVLIISLIIFIMSRRRRSSRNNPTKLKEEDVPEATVELQVSNAEKV